MVRTGSHGSAVGQRVPEMRRIVEFICASTSPVCAERHHTGVQYSPTEYQRANADVQRVSASAPQLEPASFVSRLFLFFSLATVLVRWGLKESVWSSVTPKNVG